MNDDWRDEANCKGHTDLMVLCAEDANYAFSARRKNRLATNSKIAQGLLLCQNCPVIRECNQWAEDNEEQLIIAGGKVRGGWAHTAITFRTWREEINRWEKSLRRSTPAERARQRRIAQDMHRAAGHNVADAS